MVENIVTAGGSPDPDERIATATGGQDDGDGRRPDVRDGSGTAAMPVAAAPGSPDSPATDQAEPNESDAPIEPNEPNEPSRPDEPIEPAEPGRSAPPISSATSATPASATDAPDTRLDVHIEDVPPRRTRDFGDLAHAAGSLVLAVAMLLVAVYLRGMTAGVESDAHTAGQAIGWLMDVPASLLQQIATIAIVACVLFQLLVSREWVQSAISLIAMFGGYAAVWGVSAIITHVGFQPLVLGLSSPAATGGTGLLPDFYAGFAAFLTAAGPRRMRSSVKWGWNALYVLAVLLVVLSWNSVPGVLVSFAVGRIVGMTVRFATGTQNKGAWGRQLVQALETIGLEATSLVRRPEAHGESGVLRTTLDDDLAENSRIYDMVDRYGRRFTVSVIDGQSHNAGYLNQLWQWLRLTGVTTRRDRSVSDAVHHHFTMLLAMGHIGLAAPRPYGIVDCGESAVLVLDADSTAMECNLNTLTEDDAAALMRYLDVAHRRGLSHHRITPDTLGRLAIGTPVIAGWQNGDCTSTAANLAIDKVQLLTLLAMLIGVGPAVRAARRVWGDDALVGLVPFVQKAAIPAGTRALNPWGRQLLDEVRDALRALAPQEVSEAMEPVKLSRFSVKSFLMIVLLIVAVSVVITQLRPDEVIDAISNANPGMALLCVLCGLVAWLGSALTLGVFMDRGRRSNLGVFMAQAASGFTAVSMPAGVGPAFVNLQFLRKSGYRSTRATAIMSAVWAIQGGTTILLLLVIGVFTGRNMLSGMIPTNTLVIAIAAVALVVSVAMAIPPVRRLVAERYLPIVKAYARQLVNVLTQPKELAIGFAGALVLNLATGLGFWAALMAFGYPTNPIETTFVFLLANTLGSAVPTPGGLGAVEAALTFAFTSVGVPAAVALSATLVYRVAFYWLRIPMGALAMKWLDRHNLF